MGLIQELKEVEGRFFELDKEKRIAHVRLRLDKASDMFDESCASKRPIMSAVFLEQIGSIFRMVSPPGSAGSPFIRPANGRRKSRERGRRVKETGKRDMPGFLRLRA